MADTDKTALRKQMVREKMDSRLRTSREAMEKGEHLLTSPDGGQLPVRSMDDVFQAVDQGATGRLDLVVGGEVLEFDADQLRRLSPQLRSGLGFADQRSLPQFDKQVEDKVIRELESQGGLAAGSGVIASVAGDLGLSEREKINRQLLTENNPIAALAGTAAGAIGTSVVAGGALSKLGLLAKGRAVRMGQELFLEAGANVQMDAAMASLMDEELTPEQILASGAQGAALGLAFRGVGKVTGMAKDKLLSRRVAAKALEREIGEEAIQSALKLGNMDDFIKLSKAQKKQVLDDAGRVFKATDSPKEATEYLRRHLKDVDLNVSLDDYVSAVRKNFDELDTLFKDGPRAWKVAQREFKQPPVSPVAAGSRLMDIAADVRAAGTSYAGLKDLKKFDKFAKKLEDLGTAATTGKVNPQDLRSRIDSLADEMFAVKGAPPELKAYENILRKVKRDEAIFGGAGLDQGIGDDAISIVAEFATKFKRGLVKRGQDQVSFDKLRSQLMRGGEEFSFVNQAGLNKVEGALDQLIGLNNMNINEWAIPTRFAVRNLSKELQAGMGSLTKPGPLRLAGVAKEVSKQVSSQKQNFLGSLGQEALRVGIGAAGVGVGIPGWVSYGLGNLVVHTAGGRAAGALAHAVSAAKAVQRGISSGGKAIKQAAGGTAVPFTVAGIGTYRAFASESQKREEFANIQQGIVQSTANLVEMQRHLETLAEATSDMNSSVGQGVAMGAATAALYLQEQLPEGNFDELSMIEVDDFMEKFYAVQYPTDILKEAAAGTLSQGMVDAVKTVYPKLYDKMLFETMSNIGDDVTKLPYALKVSLTKMTGVPLDPTLAPNYVATFRNQGAQTQLQDQAINGARTNLVSDALAGAEQTGTARIANK